MKHLCYSKLLLVLLFVSTTLFASLKDKSAMIFYGEHISYSMVGIHDYIIVAPENINTFAHGYRVYQNKIYARVLLSNHNSLKKQLLTLYKQNFHNFYIDTKSTNIDANQVERVLLKFHKKFQDTHFIANLATQLPNKHYELYKAVVSETPISKTKREALQSKLLDIIQVVFKPIDEVEESQKEISQIKAKQMIPLVTNRTFDIYGQSSKTAIKREILTLIDEGYEDRTVLGAHRLGALPIEYLGYIQKLYNINQGLPNIDHMHHYAGVVIWLSIDYKYPAKLINWVLELKKIGIKVAFANSFGFGTDAIFLKPLDIDILDRNKKSGNKRVISYQDKMMGFEMDPTPSNSSQNINPNNAKPLLTYKDENGGKSTLAAITSWGGYAISEAFIVDIGSESWVINPFEFFAQALRLKKLVIPDQTTENGKRLLFSHIDGDGFISRAEFNPEWFSGYTILNEILKVYKVPHSVSVIGAEIFPNGLYPQFSKKAMGIAREMYALDNVEAASHTFTHTFFWGKIKDGKLSEEYRLKPKGYTFNLYDELPGTLKKIDKLVPLSASKRARTVFWSGDCTPRFPVLDYIYKKGILNINGGDTTISNINPWICRVSPMGLERGDYYQIYTGAQNENVFTNDWLGPFWGFKRVVQTFKLTNSPRRFKPIDIYYHLYSGSKKASLNALKYVFNWAISQEVMPIFTSEYIPKAMDYFTASLANEKNTWLVDGMHDLKTIRIEFKDVEARLNNSPSVMGIKHFENHTYLHLSPEDRHIFTIAKNAKNEKDAYLIASNAKVLNFTKTPKYQTFHFKGNVPLKLQFHIPQSCTLKAKPKSTQNIKQNSEIILNYNTLKEAHIDVICR